MKTPPATKGRAFERKIAEALRSVGLDVRLHGQWESHDLTVTVAGTPLILECKDCKRLSLGDIDKELANGNFGVVHKRFRGKKRVTLDFDAFVELLIDLHFGDYPTIDVLAGSPLQACPMCDGDGFHGNRRHKCLECNGTGAAKGEAA